jgi:hypothetical protein
MIATQRFVFLHLHKSGGTFVNECLLRFFPDAKRLGYHLPRRLIPPAFTLLPVIGLVRNPWSYYVSWYSFQATRSQPNALFKTLSENGRLNFKQTIRNLLLLGDDNELLDRVVAALPQIYPGTGLNLPGFALEPIRNSSLGFYSYLYRYMYGETDAAVHIGQMEALRDELPALFAAVEQPIDATVRLYIANRAPANTSQHAAYPQYYDDELRELVAVRDAQLINRHQYRFAK